MAADSGWVDAAAPRAFVAFGAASAAEASAASVVQADFAAQVVGPDFAPVWAGSRTVSWFLRLVWFRPAEEEKVDPRPQAWRLLSAGWAEVLEA